jgi:hypothetical protein
MKIEINQGASSMKDLKKNIRDRFKIRSASKSHGSA